MAATGLSADPKEYRKRLAEQSDEQIDAWAAELMRDVAKRRGVIRVLTDLRKAADLSESDIERVFASGNGPMASLGRDAQGRQMIPAVALYALVPGIRARDAERPRPPDRLPRRELRRARLRLTRLAIARRPASSGSSIPFPSVLDGLVVAAVALVAGGGLAHRRALGLSMTSLQFAIGALNDIVDAPADAGRVPPKPIPRGCVPCQDGQRGGRHRRGCRPAPRGAVGSGDRSSLGVVVLAVGAAYDLFAKGTPWSWLPFAVGIPLLPVYGWLGATGSLPGFFVVLVPMAVLAGAGLAVANARVDLRRIVRPGRDRWRRPSAPEPVVVGRVWSLMAAATRSAWRSAGSRWAWPVAPGARSCIGGTLRGLGRRVVGRGEGPAPGAAPGRPQAIGAAIAATGWVAGMLPEAL